ncbi:hypothetical protein K0M31_018841 [Melipona bicolor]|uniref:Uncharacterized protein n=1 Tax=Melipona bicolor TaxID=60889 RepID=A0AA40G420_9HYME|nr:hypothetical protein K0M31_018841 [Melipona bicolor]
MAKMTNSSQGEEPGFLPRERERREVKRKEEGILARGEKEDGWQLSVPGAGLQSKRLASRDCNCTACQLLHYLHAAGNGVCSGVAAMRNGYAGSTPALSPRRVSEFH